MKVLVAAVCCSICMNFKVAFFQFFLGVLEDMYYRQLEKRSSENLARERTLAESSYSLAGNSVIVPFCSL